MAADGTLATVVTLVWVCALAAVLLVQAFAAWLGHRQATRSAREAQRLAKATEPRRAEVRDLTDARRERAVPTAPAREASR